VWWGDAASSGQGRSQQRHDGAGGEVEESGGTTESTEASAEVDG
jgi:hypothetical protein